MLKRFLRICSALLTLVMLFNMIPLNAIAEEYFIRQGTVLCLTNKRNQAYFTHNPYMFQPTGLMMLVYPGSSNGRIIKWVDPYYNVIFEWNEDLKNGPRYHIMMAEWKGNHYGLHFSPGAPVPEPWNTIYLGSYI